MMPRMLIMLPDQAAPEVAVKVPPYGMDVVGLILGVVKFNEKLVAL